MRAESPSPESLRTLRLDAGWSLRQLARACGVTGETVRLWEGGSLRPGPGPAARLAGAWGKMLRDSQLRKEIWKRCRTPRACGVTRKSGPSDPPRQCATCRARAERIAALPPRYQRCAAPCMRWTMEYRDTCENCQPAAEFRPELLRRSRCKCPNCRRANAHFARHFRRAQNAA